MGLSRLWQMIVRAKTTLLRTRMGRSLGYQKKVFRNLLITLKTYYSKKLGSYSQLDRFYTHARDLPYYNWAMLHDHDKENIKWLLKPDQKSKSKKCFDKAYEMIATSLIDVYGYPEG
jgi:hypothetical protein